MTIEREIDGFRWLVTDDGAVHRNERTVLSCEGDVCTGYNWSEQVVNVARSLRDEFFELSPRIRLLIELDPSERDAADEIRRIVARLPGTGSVREI